MKRKALKSSELLQSLISDPLFKENLTVGKLLASLGDRSFGLMILVFVVPSLLPFSIVPGLSVISATPILILAIQMVIGMNTVKLPNWLASKKISHAGFVSSIQRILPVLRWLEKFLKPRWGLIFSNLGTRLVAIALIILSLLLMLPIPFSNMIFGVFIVFIALGLIESDGLILSIGVIGSIFSSYFLVVMVLTLFRHFMA